MVTGNFGGLILLVVIAVPVALFLRYIRRPVNDAPKDALAVMGMVETADPVHLVTSQAGEDLLKHSSRG